MTHIDPPLQPTPLTAEQEPALAAAHHQPESGTLGDQEIQIAADMFSAGRYSEAAALAQNLTVRFPGHSFGWKLLGSIYAQIGRYAEALVPLRKAAELLPPDAEVHKNLGVLLIHLGQFDAALLSCRRALEIKPNSEEAHHNLGCIFHNLGRLDESVSSFRRALEIRPDFHFAAWNLATALLAQGRYSEGLPFYEIRYVLDTAIVPDLPFPAWRGEPLHGKSILLCPEQGFGDYIQFVRYASLLKERGVSRLTIRCRAPLKDLLAMAPGVDEVITAEDPVPPHDYWSLPLSLPLHFGTTLESIPASLPYLQAPAARIEQWRSRLPAGGFKVGLVWKGASRHTNDAHRSLPELATLAPLWRVPGITFVSLQKGAGEEEPTTSGLPIVHLGSDVRDFADTAAIIDQLDLVICVDTAVAHVAGALGKPCWVLLPVIGCDWRWMRDRADSPWYPHVLRLFRQKEQGDWSSVIDEVTIALRNCVG